MNPGGKDSFSQVVSPCAVFYFQSSALNVKLLSFLIKTHKLIKDFNKKKNRKTFYILDSMISLCFEYLWIFANGKNIPSGTTKFGFSKKHHENRQETWPWCVMRLLKQPGSQTGELIPPMQRLSDAFLNDCDVFSLQLSWQHSIEFHFSFAPEKLNAYGKHKTFWPTVLKHNRAFW